MQLKIMVTNVLVAEWLIESIGLKNLAKFTNDCSTESVYITVSTI